MHYNISQMCIQQFSEHKLNRLIPLVAMGWGPHLKEQIILTGCDDVGSTPSQ